MAEITKQQPIEPGAAEAVGAADAPLGGGAAGSRTGALGGMRRGVRQGVRGGSRVPVGWIIVAFWILTLATIFTLLGLLWSAGGAGTREDASAGTGDAGAGDQLSGPTGAAADDEASNGSDATVR